MPCDGPALHNGLQTCSTPDRGLKDMRPELRPPAPANKLLGLEVLRFLAALSILVFHYRHFAFVAAKPVELANDRLPLYGLLHFFYDAEPYGVWVFWCISGFIFFWKYRDTIADR